jgi:hypothetical protein
VLALVSILVSVESLWRVHRQRQQPLLCLVRGTADGAEQSATRRAGVRLPVRSSTFTSGRRPDDDLPRLRLLEGTRPGALPGSGTDPRYLFSQAFADGNRKRWRLNHSPLFMDFLEGEADFG